MLSIRQESREQETHSKVAVIAYCLLWFAAQGRDPHDAVTRCINAENDHIVLVPRAPCNITRHIAHGMHVTGGDIHRLQLSSGVERDGAAVRRPEEYISNSASADFG